MDFLTDNNPVDYQFLLEQLDLPEFAKEASTSTEDIQNENAFADPSTKSYPMDTPANTYHSMVYFQAAGKGQWNTKAASYIENRLGAAAKYHGISEVCNEITKAANTTVKKAEIQKDPEYALSFKKDDTIYRFYPLNDAEDVRDSAVKLANDRRKMVLGWFMDASENIVKKANELSVPLAELPKEVTEKGVRRELDTQYVKIALDQRLRHLDKKASLTERNFDDEKQTYTDLFTSAVEDRNEIQKFAGLIEDFDELLGIDYKHIMDPIDAFYSGPQTDYINKMASEYMFVCEAMIPVSAFTGIPFEKLAQSFAKPTAEKIANLQKSASEDPSIENSLNIEHGLKELNFETQRELVQLAVDAAG
jgi:hypothetical protein